MKLERFFASMKTATSHIATANVFCSAEPDNRERRALPASIPARQPPTKRPVTRTGNCCPSTIFATTPETEMRKITISDVATAR